MGDAWEEVPLRLKVERISADLGITPSQFARRALWAFVAQHEVEPTVLGQPTDDE
jgi:hypothetical protein